MQGGAVMLKEIALENDGIYSRFINVVLTKKKNASPRVHLPKSSD